MRHEHNLEVVKLARMGGGAYTCNAHDRIARHRQANAIDYALQRLFPVAIGDSIKCTPLF